MALAGFGYQYWSKHHQGSELLAATTSAPSENGFVALPPFDGARAGAVVIFAAENCPEDGARRADQLAGQLASRGITVVRSQDAHFSLGNADSAVADRIMSVMNGDVPIVFVNGRAKSNPTLDEVVAEYRAARN